MSDRPPKLPSVALLVVWGSQVLTLGEKVVWYHDWTLDQGGPDGSYISHASLSARLGGSLSPATISTTRQRLKRLTLHHALVRVDARNLGWVSVLPVGFTPRLPREAAGLAVSLDTHLRKLEAWVKESGRHAPDSPVRPYQTERWPRTSQSEPLATAMGGLGGLSSQSLQRETPLSSAVSSTSEKRDEKGVGALAPEDEKRDRLREEWNAWTRLKAGCTLSPEEHDLVRSYQRRLQRRETA